LDGDGDGPAVTTMDRVRALRELVRLGNCAFAGVAALVGAVVGIGLAAAVAPAGLVAALVTALGTAAGNAVNDYYDVDVDAVNDPERPIPSGRVTRRGARTVAVVAFALALGITVLLLPPLAVLIGVVNLALLVGYSSHLKRTPLLGNVAVAYLTGSAFLFGGAAVGAVAATAVLFGLAALATLGREIVKDVEDLAGDREMGAATLPVRYGERPALAVASAAVVVAVLLSPVPYLALSPFGTAYLVAVVPADAVLLAGAGLSWRDASRGQTVLKLGMVVAMVAFVAGRLFG
jgi:geranylgeranylglycerol-phosphate geranylgeranyltransferase